MEPKELSKHLREGSDPDLRRRRWVVGLSVVGAVMGGAVSLYQTGIVRHLPDPPPRRLWDSDRVDASGYAYSRFSTPDALLMIVTYGLTGVLAGAGGPDRPRARPLLPVAMAAKALYDAALALELGREEYDENRALCAYCQVATVASVASAAFALPEAVRAVRHLLGSAS